MNIIEFIVIFSVLLFSIIGYGLFFSKYLTSHNNFTKNNISIGYIGIFGIFFSILISYFTNLITPHNNLHNTIFLLIGIFFFIFFNLKYKKKFFLKYFIFSYLISFFSIFYFKSHDDFSYYHLSSIINITENKLEFGIHHFDIAFNHISSIFHFHSLFKTFFTENYFYQIGPLFIVIFINTILFENIFKKKNNQSLDTSFYLNLFFLIFTNIFFYRLAEHGTDRSAQILFFLTFILSFLILETKKLSYDKFEIVLILFALIVSLKSFYILYSILLLVVYFKFFKLLNFSKFVKSFPVVYLFVITIFLVSLNSLAVSGCFVYPVVFTCVENFFWGYGKEKVILAMEWYELWSKAGANPNLRVQNPTEYVDGLNWVSNWFDNYFFNKVSDFLLGILFVILIFLISFRIKKINLRNFKNLTFIYLILILLFIEWFLNHPTLRYGGYVLIYLIFVTPVSLIISNQNYNFKEKKKPIKIILSIVILVFISRNVNRLITENEIYNYNLFKNPVYNIQDQYFTMQNRKKTHFYNTKICDLNNSKTNLKCKKIAGFNFYFKY
tara:strand:- start:2114 stop:3775 length:1662 start_codon:yes stop_codon:yes gene_type:complete